MRRYLIMKIWKYSILFVSMIVLLTASISISAETEADATGDVMHWRTTESGFNWEYDADKPNIDITGMSCDVDAGTITLSMTVAGTIEDSEFIAYSLHYNGDDSSYYMVSYANGEGLSMYSTPTGGGVGSVPVITSGNTITCTFDGDIDDHSTYAFLATTYQHTVLNDVTAEYWTDVNSDDAGDDGSSSDDEGTSTPGFEILTLIAAIGIAIIVLRKRK
jgi:hypothetical protein